LEQPSNNLLNRINLPNPINLLRQVADQPGALE